MIEHLSNDIAYRKEVLSKTISLSKNSIYLICVIVMQLLQSTQGLATEEDLFQYNVAKHMDNSSLHVVTPSMRTFRENKGTVEYQKSSVLTALNHDTLNVHPVPNVKVHPSPVDSLTLSLCTCSLLTSCDTVEVITKNNVFFPSNKLLASAAEQSFLQPDLPLDDTTSQTLMSKNITATPILKTMTGIDCESKSSTTPANSNYIQNYDEKCKSYEVFVTPQTSKAQFRLRIKREADAAKKSNFRNRFRRPTTTTKQPAEEEEVEEESKSVSPPTTHRRTYDKSGSSRSNANKPSPTSKKRLIKPSRVSSVPSSRAKFTLREREYAETTTQKASTPTRRAPFRRPQLSSSTGNKRVTTPSKISSSKSSSRRGNKHEDSLPRSTLSGRSRPPSTTGRSRSVSFKDADSRNRIRGPPENNEPIVFHNDGTITITHLMPSETQIPVVNGQITEYKEIVVAKTSTEVLGPQQYTKSFGANGQTVLVLTSQRTSINVAGATEITQYILHESPTTSVTFTPTTIRGRRTSFSYVVPSTAYSVENIVSTVQPQISADAPLANILLSQLLLGNVGFPANQLFGAVDNANANPAPQTPSTEYRTHTSTYVTTVYEGTSTVLPITFQGKRIITTIYDTTPNVITATEFVTDTIVLPAAKPSQVQAPAINSLLLQQLLLQQVAQEPKIQNPLINLNPTTQQPSLFETSKLPDYDTGNNFHDTGHNALLPSTDSFTSEDAVEVTTERGKPRRNGKKHKRRHKDDSKSDETSVITLYVSGKFPGEFSTILSTVHVRPEATVHKRHATDYYGTHDTHQTSESYQLPKNLEHEDVAESKQEVTQSLADILGDRHKWSVVKEPIL